MNALALAAVACSTLLGATGALLLKKGAGTFSISLSAIRNGPLVAGGIAYLASIPPYLFGLQYLPVSVAYPLTSMTYVWSATMARIYLKEQITPMRWTGIALVVIGVTVLSL